MFKTLFLSGREYLYQRNDVLIRALGRIGEVELASISTNSILQRSLYSFLYFSFNRKIYDFLTVGFYGHLIMMLLGIVSHSPIVFDVFLSTFDTLCFDRKILKPKSIGGRFAFLLDFYACKKASILLLDTYAHIQFFVDTLKIPYDKFYKIPVGCNEDIFFPRFAPKNTGKFRILFYSSYLPLHGVEVIVEAAKRLEKFDEIVFRLVGYGPTYKKIKLHADKVNIRNVEFIPPMSIEKLAQEIAQADICIGGHFGVSEKAKRVIPGKIYQILACGKPLIAADTEANRELLTNGESAVLCRGGDPVDLAEKILLLYENRTFMDKLAKHGRDLYIEKCSEKVITELIRNALMRSGIIR